MDKPLPKLVKLVFVLAGIAVSLPIVCKYEMAFFLLLWLAIGGSWRLARIGRTWLPAPGSPDHGFMAAAAAGLRPIHWGALLYVSCLLVSALLGCAFSEYSKPLTKTLAVWSHQWMKAGLQWFVLSGAMLVAVRRGWNPRRIAKPLLAWMVVNLFYCLAQRAWGIDWSHGLHTILPPNRFAYGVFRVSGFMGHPLHFAYNLELLLLTAVALGVRLGDTDETGDRRAWWGVALVTAMTLLISGSRFVLIVIAAVLALAEWRRGLRYWKWVLAGLALLAVGLYLEGSVIGRFGELFDQSVPLAQRFPRLFYWKMHWLMFVDHPWIGVTMAGSEDATLAYYTAAGVHDNLFTAHNMFLQTMADTGLVGLTGLLGLLAGLLVSMRRLGRLAGGAQGLGYLILGTILTGLMQNDLRDSEFLNAFWFLLSLVLVQSAVLSARRRPDASDGDERKPAQDLEPAAGRADPA